MQLHLVCATIEGKLLHTARKPTGTWYPFEEIKDQAGSVGPVLTLSCAGDHCTMALHVCTVSKDGRLLAWSPPSRENIMRARAVVKF